MLSLCEVDVILIPKKKVADHLGMEQPNYHKLESDTSKVRIVHLEKLADLYKSRWPKLLRQTAVAVG
jgi:hypothetical protein